MLKLAFAALLAGAQLPAGAAELQVRMVNNTPYGIDFSLQMAQRHGARVSAPTFLGKALSTQIGYVPILDGQGAATSDVPYASTDPGNGDDAISLNLRMRVTWNEGYNWEYVELGMLRKIFGGPHVCDVHAGGPVHDGEIVLLDLQPSTLRPYVLSEILPNGDSCSFYISRGFGPVVWGPEHGAEQAEEPEAGAQDLPGLTRAMRGAELARIEPALHARLDEDYLRATGVDLRAVRERNARLAPQ